MLRQKFEVTKIALVSNDEEWLKIMNLMKTRLELQGISVASDSFFQ